MFEECPQHGKEGGIVGEGHPLPELIVDTTLTNDYSAKW